MTPEADKEKSAERINFHWDWNWKVLLFALVFFPLTLKLGFWQLSRAEQKQTILNVHQQRVDAAPVSLQTLENGSDQQYVNVSVKGRFENSAVLLLDNRVRRGRPGYEVVSVFRSNASDIPAVLVNRGWVEGSLDRSVLPEVPLLSGEVEVFGYLYRSPGQQLMLGSDPWRADKALQIVQNAAPEIVAERFGEPIYGYTLRLDQHSLGALQTGWHVVNVQPSKHQGYAFQWFLMAIVLLLLTLWANSNLAEVWRGHGQKVERENE